MSALFKNILSTRSDKSYDPLTVFAFMLGIYGLINCLYYFSLTGPFKYLTLVSSLALLIFPHRPLSVAAFGLSSVAEYIYIAPVYSNHLIIAFLISFYISLSWIWCVIKERSINVDERSFYKRFAPGGRLALITMYFFGVFQKINAPFLDPEISCATTLIHFFIFVPNGIVFPNVIYYAASYGTLIIETVIALLLFFPKTRYYAVVAGVAFHLLISLSAYRYYVPFTMLSIVMHSLFVDPDILNRIRKTKWNALLKLNETLMGRLALLAPLLAGFMFYQYHYDFFEFHKVLPIWFILGLLLLIFITLFDRPEKPLKAEKHYMVSRFWPVNIIAALFFLSCFSPYIGFKTAHAISMFSNLHTEGGESNHYIIQKPVYLFDYQNDLVRILDTDDMSLEQYIHPDIAMIGYEFESHMIDNPESYVKYERGGEVRVLKGLDEETYQEFYKPLWQRKFIVFAAVNTSKPRSCMDPTDVYRIKETPYLERWYLTHMKK